MSLSDPVQASAGSRPQAVTVAPRSWAGRSYHIAAWLSLLFIASRVLILLFLAGRGSDLGLHQSYVAKILAGRVPFRDFFPEYPPLVFLLTGIPALFDRSLVLYFPIFRACCCVIDCFIWTMLLWVSRGRVGPGVLYILASTALGPILYDRIDIALGAMLMIAIIAMTKNRPRLRDLAIGTGIAFKLVPIVWAPAILSVESRKGPRQLAWTLLLLALPTVISFDAVAAFGGWRFDTLFAYHSLRGIQLESGPASVEMFLMRLGADGAVTFEFGSFNLHTRYEPLLAAGATTVLAQMVLASAAWAWRRKPAPEPMALLLAGVLCGAMVLSKVLSPQFTTFLLPVLMVVPQPRERMAVIGNWSLILAIYLLTGAIFPWTYDSLVRLEPGTEVLLIVRNVLLLILSASLFTRAWAAQAPAITASSA